MSLADGICGTGSWTGPVAGDPNTNSILTVTAVYGGVEVAWTYPTINAYAVAHTLLYRGVSSDFATAVLHKVVTGNSHYDKIDAATSITYFYWIRIVSVHGTEGELIGPATVATVPTVQQIMGLLTDQLDESQLVIGLRTKIANIAALDSSLLLETQNRIASNVALGNALTAVQTETGELTTYILNETSQRVNADSAQVTAVNSLAVGQGANAAAIVNESTVRLAQDLALAEQITLLSAGSGEQFDYVKIWYFDTSIESWTTTAAGTTASMVAGWLKIVSDAGTVADANALSPAALAIEGVKYTQVRARIRKVGTPTWEGALYFTTVADNTWTVGKSITTAEPTYDVNNIGLLTVNMPATWTAATITQLRLELSTSVSTTSYFEIDWVAVGRPSPGASSAQLLEEKQARIDGDTVLTQSTTALSARLNAGGDVSTAINSAQSTATTALDDAATAQWTALGKNKSFYQVTAPTATAIGDLWIDTDDTNKLYRWDGFTWINIADTRIVTTAQNLSTLQATVDSPTSGLLTKASIGYVDTAQATAISASATASQLLVSSIGGQNLYGGSDSLVAHDTDYGAYGQTLKHITIGNPHRILPGELLTLSGRVWQNAASLAAGQVATLYLWFATNTGAWTSTTQLNTASLTPEYQAFTITVPIEANMSEIAVGLYHQGGSTGNTTGEVYADRIQVERGAIATAYKAAAASVADLSGATAAIQTEATTRVTADGALATSVTTLSSQVNHASTGLPAAHAAVSTEATTRATQTGELYAQYTVKVDVNGHVAGYGLASTPVNGTPYSEFAIVADKFSIAPVATNHAAADGSPFFHLTAPTVIGGVTVPAGTYMKAAHIHDASITNAKIANATIASAKIASLDAAKIIAGTITTNKLMIGSVSANATGAASAYAFLNASPPRSSDSLLNSVLTTVVCTGGYIQILGGVEFDFWHSGQAKAGTYPTAQSTYRCIAEFDLYNVSTGVKYGFTQNISDSTGTALWYGPPNGAAQTVTCFSRGLRTDIPAGTYQLRVSRTIYFNDISGVPVAAGYGMVSLYIATQVSFQEIKV